MTRRNGIAIQALALILFPLFAEGSSFSATGRPTTDGVRLFQSFLRDAVIAPIPYAEAGATYDDFDFGGRMTMNIQGGIPILADFELCARFALIHMDPDRGAGKTGLGDVAITLRYDIKPFLNVTDPATRIAGGGFLTLPAGRRAVGEDSFDIGVFGTLRHNISHSVVLSSVIGMNSLDTINRKGRRQRKASLLAGGGLILMFSDRISFVTELNRMTGVDHLMLSGGVDYGSGPGRARSSLGVGLDDGTPDISLTIGYSVDF